MLSRWRRIWGGMKKVTFMSLLTSKEIWIAAYWIYYSWGTCLQSLRSEKRGLKKPKCEMVKDFAVNSGRKINSLKLFRKGNLDPVWTFCFKESVEQKSNSQGKGLSDLGQWTKFVLEKIFRKRKWRKRKARRGNKRYVFIEKTVR